MSRWVESETRLDATESRKGRNENQAVGWQNKTDLRKSHTYKLRLTLLSGVESGVERERERERERESTGPGPVNERGRLTGLIYVQFGNRTNRYEPPYQEKRKHRRKTRGPGGTIFEVFDRRDLGFREYHTESLTTVSSSLFFLTRLPLIRNSVSRVNGEWTIALSNRTPVSAILYYAPSSLHFLFYLRWRTN